jgi:hypothetical protein
MVTYTGTGIGRLSTWRSIMWCGSVLLQKQYYSRISGLISSSSEGGGKLSFLNKMVGLFESEIDAVGNFSEKAWGWK